MAHGAAHPPGDLVGVAPTPNPYLTYDRSAWSGLRHGSANMSVLVVLGTSAAYLYSVMSMVGDWAHHRTPLFPHRRMSEGVTPPVRLPPLLPLPRCLPPAVPLTWATSTLTAA